MRYGGTAGGNKWKNTFMKQRYVIMSMELFCSKRNVLIMQSAFMEILLNVH